MKKTILVLSALVLFGCANSDERIASKTAQYLNVPVEKIKLKSAEKNALDTNWTVQVNESEYTCSADDMLRDMKCNQTLGN